MEETFAGPEYKVCPNLKIYFRNVDVALQPFSIGRVLFNDGAGVFTLEGASLNEQQVFGISGCDVDTHRGELKLATTVGMMTPRPRDQVRQRHHANQPGFSTAPEPSFSPGRSPRPRAGTGTSPSPGRDRHCLDRSKPPRARRVGTAPPSRGRGPACRPHHRCAG